MLAYHRNPSDAHAFFFAGTMTLNHPFITGDRIYLRGLTIDDVDGPWLDWFNNQENTQFMFNGTYPPSREGQLEFYHNVVRSEDNLVLAICLVSDNRHVGNVGLHTINWLTRVAELGVIVGERSVQGQGVGSEAVKLIADHGFNRLGLHKIWLRTEEENKSARRAFEKAGFKEEGIIRQEICRDGKRLMRSIWVCLPANSRALVQLKEQLNSNPRHRYFQKDRIYRMFFRQTPGLRPH